MRRAQFDAVFQKPDKRVSAAPLWLAARASPAGVSRLGLVVGKKMLRRAVDRNRAKRAIRESFRLRTRMPPMDVVVRVVEPRRIAVADARRLFDLLEARLRSNTGPSLAP